MTDDEKRITTNDTQPMKDDTPKRLRSVLTNALKMIGFSYPDLDKMAESSGIDRGETRKVIGPVTDGNMAERVAKEAPKVKARRPKPKKKPVPKRTAPARKKTTKKK